MAPDKTQYHETVRVQWLEESPSCHRGATFGLPWCQGVYFPEHATFSCSDSDGHPVPLTTRHIGFWPDGSLKWTSHDIPATSVGKPEYFIHVSLDQDLANLLDPRPCCQLRTEDTGDHILVDTGKLTACFPRSGQSLITSLKSAGGTIVGKNGRLILLDQERCGDTSEPGPKPEVRDLVCQIEEMNIETSNKNRIVIVMRGRHVPLSDDKATSTLETDGWLPYTIRFYLYAGSDALKVMHTIVWDGDMHSNFIRGIGLRFDIPFHGEELYNRHVRFAGVDDGVFGEAVKGVTGLWRDPGSSVKVAQLSGRPTPPTEEWSREFVPYFKWVPAWNRYSLNQLTPDGFTLNKKTKTGQSWVKTPSGTRAGGLSYLGSANHGGLAIGMRHFWERYPTSLETCDAAETEGHITLWLYSPSAEPMDLRPYHDGLGEQNYTDQLDALKITYEDWEPDLGSPHGIARTNEIYVFVLSATPSAAEVSQMSNFVRQPPVLVPESRHIYRTAALGNYWKPVTNDGEVRSTESLAIEKNLEFLFQFYVEQISQRRWYGFWDHGDIMHTYDADRHTWRYDIGGYAWDNSELSPDLWLWIYYLRTGRSDVYRMAEALTRHTGEVDVYHLGQFRGLGTRHGVQHWGDSCKQARVSNGFYRRTFFYLTGGDERVGELLTETLAAESTFLTLDPYRKVRPDDQIYVANPETLSISLGTDWSALASAWYVEWERRGPQWRLAKSKLITTMQGIAALKNGFVTGTASYNLHSGQVWPPCNDKRNVGIVKVSHLSAMFGLVEICTELIGALGEDLPKDFEAAWVDYCHAFNASEQEQEQRYGVRFGKLQLRQGHSRLTAYAAVRLSDDSLRHRAWREFYTSDGYAANEPWRSECVGGDTVLLPVSEAPWVSTNISALYALAAMQNLAWLGDPVLTVVEDELEGESRSDTPLGQGLDNHT